MTRKLSYAVMFFVVLNISACKVQQKKTNQTAPEISMSNDATNITDKHWKLVELNGNPVESTTPVFIFMHSEDGRVHGNLGCNTFSGSYTLENGNRIRFSQLINTQMFCFEGMDIEAEMVRILQTADNYNLTENRLSLNRARMAPLARFEMIATK